MSTMSPQPTAATPRQGAAGPVLEVRGLRMHLHTRWGVIRAVDGVSFDLQPGETMGIVGESGSGKSMLALSLVRLTPKPVSRFVGGHVLFNGRDLLTVSEADMRRIRGREISMILQDPHQSLNPVLTVGGQLEEALRDEDRTTRRRSRDTAIEALRKVRIAAPEGRMRAYPHQLSGGMKQRIVGAIAMAKHPKVLIADEPTTALDVTHQAQYLRLLKDLQRDTGVAIVLITHDLGVVAAMCDRVAVMYAGRFVEQGSVREIFDRAAHPYTRALLASLPRIDGEFGELASIEGHPPSLIDLPAGCRFAPRCLHARPECRDTYPSTFSMGDGHSVSCWKMKEEGWPPRD